MSRPLVHRTLVPVALIMAVFVTVCFILLYSYVRMVMQDAIVERAVCMAKTVARSTSYDMLHQDHAALNYMVINIGENPDVAHLRIFDKKGVIRFSRNEGEVGTLVDSKAESCNVCHNSDFPLDSSLDERVRTFTSGEGQNVLGVTLPIPRQDGCVTAACHAGSGNLSLLGTVDVGVSQKSLEQNLAAVRKGLIGFWVMVVLLSLGLFSVIIQRNILQPVARLVRYAKNVCRGECLDEEEPNDCHEFRYLARLFRERCHKSNDDCGH
ncbi:MAG: hypothetical protein JXR59_09590 [Desulfuromonadaceae bacterium]|nr:hypothetical protein [Desulfuromonadaceae bacterium]